MDSYTSQSLREMEANSGLNLYNILAKRGARRAGLNRERAYQAADDMLGADPGILQTALQKIADESGREYQGVEENATLAAAESARQLAEYRHKIALEEQARRDATRNEWLGLGAGLVGAGISGGTSLLAAKMGADAVKSLGDQSTNTGVGDTTPSVSLASMPPLQTPTLRGLNLGVVNAPRLMNRVLPEAQPMNLLNQSGGIRKWWSPDDEDMAKSFIDIWGNY